LGQLLYAAKIVAEKEGIDDGFRVVINNGPSACKPLFLVNNLSGSFSLAYSAATTHKLYLILFILIRSICVSSALACIRWQTDELATWLKVDYYFLNFNCLFSDESLMDISSSRVVILRPTYK